MGQDMWGVFSEACEDIDTKSQFFNGDDGEAETYKDLDKFLANIRKQSRKDRVLNLAEAIIKSTLDEDCTEAEFLSACQDMISGYDEIDVCIMKHRWNSLTMVGDIPQGSTLTIRNSEDNERGCKCT